MRFSEIQSPDVPKVVEVANFDVNILEIQTEFQIYNTTNTRGSEDLEFRKKKTTWNKRNKCN